VATTEALGIAAPLGSFTVPVILPPTWAKRTPAQKNAVHGIHVFECMGLVYAESAVSKRHEND
jgi:hypothetical protein